MPIPTVDFKEEEGKPRPQSEIFYDKAEDKIRNAAVIMLVTILLFGLSVYFLFLGLSSETEPGSSEEKLVRLTGCLCLVTAPILFIFSGMQFLGAIHLNMRAALAAHNQKSDQANDETR
jgi:hypothetical protein